MENTEVMIGLVLGILIASVIAGAVIWLVGKLNVGLTVKNFGWAMLAGLIIGLLSNLITQLIPDIGSGLAGFVISLVVSAVVILVAGKILKGLSVDGFKGALFAAMAIAIIQFMAIFLTTLSLA